MTKDDDRLAYSVTDACRQLGIGRSTLYEELAAGRLKAVKFGSKTLITSDALREWLAALPAFVSEVKK